LALAVSGGSDYHGDGTRRCECFGVVDLPVPDYERLVARAGPATAGPPTVSRK